MRLSSIKKLMLIIACVLVFAGVGIAQGHLSKKKWEEWVGKNINLAYDCCGMGTCMFIRGAKLMEVTDKVVIIIVNGAQFLIPHYMINSLELSK